MTGSAGLLVRRFSGIEMVQELLRHANSRITLDLYAQAGMPASGWHKANFFGWYSTRERRSLNWTKFDHEANCQFPASA